MDRALKNNINYTNYFGKNKFQNNIGRAYYRKIYIKNIEKYGMENACCNFNNYIGAFTRLILREEKNIYLLKYPQLDSRFSILTSDDVLEIRVNITSKCKLSCRDCYVEQNRKRLHNQEVIMNIDKILKEVILNKYPKIFKEYIITFYGGDPLLEFYNILKIIDQLNSNHYINIQFNILTNGLLLTDEIVDEIVCRNLYLYIKFADNEDFYNLEDIKHYHEIKENLIRFKKRHTYNRNIKIMTSYDFYTDLEELDEFYEDSKLEVVVLRENYLGKMNFSEKIQQEVIDNHLRQYQKLKDKYIYHSNTGKRCSSFLKCLFNK